MRSQDADEKTKEMEIPEDVTSQDEQGRIKIEDVYPVHEALQEDLRRVREVIKEEFRKEFQATHPFLGFLNEPPGKLLEALCEAQLEFNPVKMSSVNTYFNDSPYSNMDDIIAATRAALAKHGLVFMHIPDISHSPGESMLLTVLYHIPSKEKVFARYAIKGSDEPPIRELEGVDQYASGDSGYGNQGQKKKAKTRNRSHAIGSDLTYGMRQMFRALAGVPYGDEDDGNQNTADIKDGQPQGRRQGLGQRQGGRRDERRSQGKREDSGQSDGKRKQSLSEKKVWAIATFLKIDKETLEKQYTEKYSVADIKELKPKEWQEASRVLSKIQSQIKNLSSNLSYPVEVIVDYVSKNETWKEFSVKMGKVLTKEQVAEAEMVATLAGHKQEMDKAQKATGKAEPGADGSGAEEDSKSPEAENPQTDKDANEDKDLPGDKQPDETLQDDAMPDGEKAESDNDIPF